MAGGNVNSLPILLILNYWETPLALIGKRLDELLKQGVKQFGTFIPWQIAESDISHSLTRFLQAAAERHMKVFLIVSPEVGIHFPNSGLPKDIIAKKENRAKHFKQDPITIPLAPHAFTLPSLFAPEYNKRYSSFLARMDGYFCDLGKNQSNLLRDVTVVLSGSFWKYYRAPVASSDQTFGNFGGDYSTHAAAVYRQQVDQFFSQKEFMDPTPLTANQWKTRSLEEVNRRWFYQQAEDIFRTRSYQTIRRKSQKLEMAEMEIFVPEADPAMVYSNFLQMVSGIHTDFCKLSRLLDESASRSAWSCTAQAPTYFHWTSMGGFRMLAEPEKQFLILKSILLTGGQRGGLIVDEAEWFSLSKTFRTRTEALARSFGSGELRGRNRALYLAPHLWSSAGVLWDELVKRVGNGAKLIASLDLITREKSANLLIVDPRFILTKEIIHKLIAWAKAGKVVVLPQSPLYTEAAKKELDRLLVSSHKIEVDFGLQYNLYALKVGKVITYEIPGGFSESYQENFLDNAWKKSEPLASYQGFLNAVLAVAEIENDCRLSDSRLSMIAFESNQNNLALFILNGTSRQISANIIFSKEVRIADLGAALSRGDTRGSGAEHPTILTQRFPLDVPPFGVLPLSIEGLSLVEQQERHLAAQISDETERNASMAATSELPGFNPDANLEELWN